MEEFKTAINRLLVEVFNDILMIEETALKKGFFNDITVTEAHTIEAVGMYAKHTMSEIAKKLHITVGTLTVAVDRLVKKGYVERTRGDADRRVVQVGLTKKGRLLYRTHQHFHSQMILDAVSDLSEEEHRVLASALTKIHDYFKRNFTYK